MPESITGCIDLSERFARLAEDLCLRIPELGHIDPERVLFCLARSRCAGTHGLYARITPLRFPGGGREMSRRRGGHLETFRLPTLIHQGREILYVVHLLMPRFLRLSFAEKLNTVIHELYHIGAACDGDIRRFAGRNYAHGRSRKDYDRHVARLADAYLACRPEAELLDFLRLGESEWREGGLRLTGLRLSRPRAQLVARRPC